MTEPSAPPAAPAASVPDAQPALVPVAPANNLHVILHVAWMAIVLGVLVQLVVLAFAGVNPKSPVATFIADLSQKISWATMVCVAVAVGTAASKAMPAIAGLAGMIAAPVAFIVAKTVHKSLGQAIGAAKPPDQTVWLLITLVAIKAIEYAVFTWYLSTLVKRQARYGKFAGSGAIAGVLTALALFGALAIFLPKLPPTGVLAGQLANEVVFPIGCATVLFTATAFAAKPKT